MIKIDFEMTDGTHVYRDALHLADDHQLTEAEIEQMKQLRFDRWLEVITNPVITEPTPEESVVEVVSESAPEELVVEVVSEQGV